MNSDQQYPLPVIEVRVDAQNLFGIYINGRLEKWEKTERKAKRAARREFAKAYNTRKWREQYKPGQVIYRV